MSFRIYDCRKDKDSVLITPKSREKFMHMEARPDWRSRTARIGRQCFSYVGGKVTFTINGEARN